MLDVHNPPPYCLVGVLTAPHAHAHAHAHAAPPPSLSSAPPPPNMMAAPDITQDPQKLSAAIQMAAALLHQPYQ